MQECPLSSWLRLPNAYRFWVLPSAYCLLPSAYCLLPTAFCLLSTIYFLLPSLLPFLRRSLLFQILKFFSDASIRNIHPVDFRKEIAGTTQIAHLLVG